MSFDMGKIHAVFHEIYGEEDNVLETQSQRWANLIHKFEEEFGERDLHFFSTPGRTEIGGNHTDHNHGRVLAAGVNLDSIAIAAVNGSTVVKMISEGYSEPFTVDLMHLDSVDSEKGTTSALIRGMAARFQALGYTVSGFHAHVTSDVLPGSGLSSSASIEVLVGTIFNHLFNDGRIPPETIAMIGQYAENHYFGKPCGLMDQMTCAVGGIVTIDFKDPEDPLVKKIDFDFASQDYRLLVVDTGGNHADLTDDYASVPKEMKSVAQALNVEFCRDLESEPFISRIKKLRPLVGDRAILRAFHFLGDNARVLDQVDALETGDFTRFLDLVNASGNSSFKWLQNIYTVKNIREQGVALALAMTEKYISDIRAGACRVHGGGFAGTIQVFLPAAAVDEYVQRMESIFGEGKVLVLSIRPHGSVHLNTFEG